jgi:hypothetical protein
MLVLCEGADSAAAATQRHGTQLGRDQHHGTRRPVRPGRGGSISVHFSVFWCIYWPCSGLNKLFFQKCSTEAVQTDGRWALQSTHAGYSLPPFGAWTICVGHLSSYRG